MSVSEVIVSEQTILVIRANVEGHTVSPTESHTHRGSSKSLLCLPTLGGVEGITFTEGPAGRRATVAGTGLDVWEIIATRRELGENFERLQEAYYWLSEGQLRAALEYYEHNSEEIEARLETEEGWTPEAVWERFPYTRPRS
jgi:uncharacterized protein (DUF433 family)